MTRPPLEPSRRAVIGGREVVYARLDDAQAARLLECGAALLALVDERTIDGLAALQDVARYVRTGRPRPLADGDSACKSP